MSASGKRIEDYLTNVKNQGDLLAIDVEEWGAQVGVSKADVTSILSKLGVTRSGTRVSLNQFSDLERVKGELKRAEVKPKTTSGWIFFTYDGDDFCRLDDMPGSKKSKKDASGRIAGLSDAQVKRAEEALRLFATRNGLEIEDVHKESDIAEEGVYRPRFRVDAVEDVFKAAYSPHKAADRPQVDQSSLGPMKAVRQIAVDRKRKAEEEREVKMQVDRELAERTRLENEIKLAIAATEEAKKREALAIAEYQEKRAARVKDLEAPPPSLEEDRDALQLDFTKVRSLTPSNLIETLV